jgi:hypothetical protein
MTAPTVTIVTFTDGGAAEIIIDYAAPAAHVLDAMDLVRLLLPARRNRGCNQI